MEPASHGVPSVLELTAELGDQGVRDRLTASVGLEMALGHVGRALGPVDEHVIPVPTENLVPPLCTLGIIEDLASAC